MKKIIVIGCPGSGKTTFAQKLAKRLSLPLFYLDAIWHKADRTHIAREEFDGRLTEILNMDSYVIDGNYSRTLERRILAADTVFFLDYATRVCLDGAISRIGKARCDMPWVDYELDPHLRAEIEEFKEKNTPTIYSLLSKHGEGKEIIIFKNREESENFLLSLGEN